MEEKTKVSLRENIIMVVTHKDGSKEVHREENLVGDEGDKHSAQKAAGEAPANTFTTLELGDTTLDTTGWTAGHPAKTSNRSHMSFKIEQQPRPRAPSQLLATQRLNSIGY